MKVFIRSLAAVVCHIACVIIATFAICSAFVILDFLYPAIDIFFFRLLVYSLLAAVTTMLISLLIACAAKGKLAGVLNVQGIASAFAISFLLLYSFLGVTTFTNERSYTIFSLAYMYESDGVVFSQQEMERIFVERFVLEGEATRFRIDEQINTGYIEAIDGGYRLSQSGQRFIGLQRFINRFFPVSTDPSSLYPLGE